MITRRCAMGSLAATAGFAGGCASNNKTLRYKTTIVIETSEGPRIGSAVREITYSFPWIQEHPQWSVEGQAAEVVTPDGRSIFALLTSKDGDVNYGGRGVWWVFKNVPATADGTIEVWPRVPKVETPRTDPVPMLVGFTDLRSSESVFKVDPQTLSQDFGPKVRLTQILLQKTDEPITKGIEKRLPWLEYQHGSLIKPTGNIHPNLRRLSVVTSASFTRG